MAAPYITVAQCEAQLDYYLSLVIVARDVMDSLGNRVTSLSPTDVQNQIDFWEKRRERAIANTTGKRSAIALVRRSSL